MLQVTWSGKYQTGAGNTLGEEVWQSFLNAEHNYGILWEGRLGDVSIFCHVHHAPVAN